jgi:hypothetical protein
VHPGTDRDCRGAARPGFDPRQVRPADMWASAEAQEIARQEVEAL